MRRERRSWHIRLQETSSRKIRQLYHVLEVERIDSDGSRFLKEPIDFSLAYKILHNLIPNNLSNFMSSNCSQTSSRQFFSSTSSVLSLLYLECLIPLFWDIYSPFKDHYGFLGKHLTSYSTTISSLKGQKEYKKMGKPLAIENRDEYHIHARKSRGVCQIQYRVQVQKRSKSTCYFLHLSSWYLRKQ